MSGPKSSRYTLTAAQLKRILEEQERRRKELEEKARKERECKEARAFLSNIKAKVDRHFEMISSSEKQLPVDMDGFSNLQDQYRSVYSMIKQVNDICSSSNSISHSVLLASRIEAERLFNEIVLKEEALVTETSNILMEHRIQEDSLIADGMNISFENVGKIESTEDSIFAETIQKLEHLLALELSQELLSEINSAIEQAKQIDNASAMQNYSSITVEPLSKKCHNYVAFLQKNKEQYYTLLDKYKALIKHLGEQETQFEFSEKGMSELMTSIAELELQAKQDAEQAYISQSVDEVMAEMGYEVIGHRHVRKKSGKEFHSKLLAYEDGTVINVTESSSGQITMEVGRTDDTDRLPDANERVALRKTMESFCNDFHEIEQRLSDRGVILVSRISMAPPEEAYAQIININDYELTEDQKATVSKKKTNQANIRKSIRDESFYGKI